MVSVQNGSRTGGGGMTDPASRKDSSEPASAAAAVIKLLSSDIGRASWDGRSTAPRHCTVTGRPLDATKEDWPAASRADKTRRAPHAGNVQYIPGMQTIPPSCKT